MGIFIKIFKHLSYTAAEILSFSKLYVREEHSELMSSYATKKGTCTNIAQCQKCKSIVVVYFSPHPSFSSLLNRDKSSSRINSRFREFWASINQQPIFFTYLNQLKP